ncbi:MAG TPA: DUF1614 domain-containing protein [Candidatus Nanoarchaeia archaeon]|nr:DUF1614 domain-containing protein [Candidatus Nanoarchaeia archaeon]
MSRKTIYFPHGFLVFALLLIALLVAVVLIFVGAVTVAFSDVGFTPFAILLLLAACFIGSAINIPLFRLKTTQPLIKEDYVTSFGVTYRIPHVEYGTATTLVAVNVGGALIPTAVSAYLLLRASSHTVFLSLVGVLVVAIVTHVVAKPVKGVGIISPAFLPPITAAIAAFILAPGHPQTVAYVSGVIGTLIGADLSNLQVIKRIGAPVASIGGAGTFDGVFLSGILAVLIAGL